jgi:hypothetical protein
MNIILNKILLFFAILLFSNNNLFAIENFNISYDTQKTIELTNEINFAEEQTQYQDEDTTNIQPDLIKIFLAHTTVGYGVDTNLFKSSKIYSAINLIGMLTNKYELISDSTIIEATQNIIKPYNSFDIAKKVNADRIFIIKVEQLKNILRTEIISVDPLNPDTVRTSEGFALLHLFNKQTDEPVYDPTLLYALQQAFAVIENDSLMFQNLGETFDVKPVPNVVISGIEFINDTSFVSWDIFSNQLIKSYEYSEMIFEEVHKSKDWILFDIDSRDAVYGMYNMFLIENNIAPSVNELHALQNFNIFYYISGKIERNKYGATISISLHHLSKDGDSKIKSYSEMLYKNDVIELKNIIKRLANKLIEN